MFQEGLQMKKFITILAALGIGFCIVNVILVVNFFNILATL